MSADGDARGRGCSCRSYRSTSFGGVTQPQQCRVLRGPEVVWVLPDSREPIL